jgi:hypothetical protein
MMGIYSGRHPTLRLQDFSLLGLLMWQQGLLRDWTLVVHCHWMPLMLPTIVSWMTLRCRCNWKR